MEHFLLHASVLSANGAVHDCGSGFSCNAACRARSNRAIDYRQSRMVLINVSHYLPYEPPALEWKTNMHDVALGDGCRLIDIDTKDLIPTLHDLQQRFADLAQANNDDSGMHSSG